jgi:2-polyprenyl-6-methoxyphenol hydroxylase-like FAD-dependent oxidoreductase
MSPIGGVGINLAIQDAVAAANLLAKPLLQDNVTEEILRTVQERREFPTRMTQRLQIFAHKRAISPALAARAPIRRLPLPFRLLQKFPVLRRVPARVFGLGFRPEHVHSPRATNPAAVLDRGPQ